MGDNLGSSEPLLEDLEGQGVWQSPPQLEASAGVVPAGGGGGEGISASWASCRRSLTRRPSCASTTFASCSHPAGCGGGGDGAVHRAAPLL